MNEYNPHSWVVINVNSEQPHKRVLASWYGGFAGSDSWKMNSGIVRVEDKGDYFLFHGHSGSIYKCYKHAYGMSSLARSVLENLQKQSDFFLTLDEETYGKVL